MRNPFKNPLKKRGIPDCVLHDGNLHHNMQQSDPPPPPSPPLHSLPHTHTTVSESLFPVGYPYGNPNYGHTNYPHTIQPPTAYPYGFPPDKREESGAVWEFNTGNNMNKKGQQRGGNIKAANTATGSALPQNGRFVFNTGNNFNEGDIQDTGNVEFANAGVHHHK